MRVLAAAIAWVAACDRREPIVSCTDNLSGVYLADHERWMILDNRATLEAFPLFDDAPDAPPGYEIAPRVIDLERLPDQLAGTVRRRFMKGAVRCEARANARVTRCGGDSLELVVSDPPTPLAYEPCAWPGPNPSRRERWRRE